jgi:DeoR/GlpR family transcriptional regulator of sugar metabolism
MRLQRSPNKTQRRRREVWAMLSQDNRVRTRDLAQWFGVSHNTMIRDVMFLERLGYIERPAKRLHAIRVLVPLERQYGKEVMTHDRVP